MQLFAYEDVLDKLDGIFDADNGQALIFYTPQLLSFLLHGALYSSPALEEWILDKCRRNVQFAHKCYWFLRAWCLEGPAESRQVTPAISRRNSYSSLVTTNAMTTTIGATSLTNGLMMSNNNNNTTQKRSSATASASSGGLTPFLDEPDVSEQAGSSGGVGKQQQNSSLCRPGSSNDFRSNGALFQSPPQPHDNDKFIPEERAMIERLMMRVKENGQVPARIVEFGVASVTDYLEVESPTRPGNGNHVATKERRGKREKLGVVQRLGVRSRSVFPIRSFGLTSETVQENDEQNNGDEYDNSPAAMLAAAKSGKIPIDPGTGYPSVNHFGAMLSRNAGHGFLSPQNAAFPMAGLLNHSRETEQFDKTPQFLDALIFLAENLFLIPREERRETLRQQLSSLECELLPSNSIYLPIGQSHHRVWRIVSEESIPISTKERVPCIVALEVIDYASKRREGPASSWNSLLMRGPLTRTASNDFYTASSSTTPDKADALMEHPPVVTTDDAAVLAEWRYGFRHPLRRTSLLDKMTTTVKGPFDKMKTHFSQLREKGISEEMQTLSLSEYLVDNNPVDSRSFCSESSNTGNEVNEHTTEIGIDEPIRSLTRGDSAGSLVSLGQWSSPPIQKKLSQRIKNRENDLDDLRSRLSAEITDKHRSSPLPYGSDQEDDPRARMVESQRQRQKSAYSTTAPDPSERSNEVSIAKPLRPPPVVFRESWVAKQERIRQKSAFGDHPGWKLLAVLIKGNDDLRQEQLASQLIQRMASILATEKVKVWLCPYEIIATTYRGGIIEAIPDTISLDSLKKNDASYTNLLNFFLTHFGEGTEELAGAKANFVESLAGYSMVCYLLQLKDRHNGNILLDKWGHIIHIDFGFFFLSSPGKNVGFESAPFKLTREFVELLDGPDSHLLRIYRDLCVKTFIALRRRCLEIILLVEMLKNGNEHLACFRGRPDDAIQQLRDRFRLDLNDRACKEYVNCLIDDSIENWRTDWYDRYQRYFVGVL